ncbi:hypothetical protein AGMMS49525_09850 [Bacteroidia bacterium]|nr:hypothetical protein AGMMS49525_09850 [Bacteroidia bacterium]
MKILAFSQFGYHIRATFPKDSLGSKTVTVTGFAEFPHEWGYVRVLLTNDYGHDLLVYESIPLVTVNGERELPGVPLPKANGADIVFGGITLCGEMDTRGKRNVLIADPKDDEQNGLRSFQINKKQKIKIYKL